jgi:hypothetical protein
MLNWLRGKFGKRNKITKNTNLTISDDDSNDSVTLVNQKEGLDDGFLDQQELATILNNPDSILNEIPSAKSTTELSGSLIENRAKAAQAMHKESEEPLRAALKVDILPPTMKEISINYPVDTPNRTNVILAESKKITAEFDEYKSRILGVVRESLTKLDVEIANFITESLNDQGVLNEFTLGKCSQLAVSKSNFTALRAVGQMLAELGDSHNQGSIQNRVE